MSGLRDRIERLCVYGSAVVSFSSVRREEGQTFVEYAVLLGVVVVTMAAALTFLHDQIGAFYTRITDDLNAALS
jgi:Flp pilus assembly pilin Flp